MNSNVLNVLVFVYLKNKINIIEFREVHFIVAVVYMVIIGFMLCVGFIVEDKHSGSNVPFTLPPFILCCCHKSFRIEDSDLIQLLLVNNLQLVNLKGRIEVATHFPQWQNFFEESTPRSQNDCGYDLFILKHYM